MKKNLLALILVLAFAFSVVGCTPKPAENSQVNNTSKTALGETAEKQNYTAEETTSKEKTQTAVSEPAVDAATESKKETAANTQTASKTAKITKDKAKSIALEAAGAKADKIYDYEIDLDRENGVLVYEIGFDYNGYEYDLHIRAEDGKVLKNIKEPEKEKTTSSKTQSTSASATIISKAKAKEIALEAAGVKANEIYDYEIELDRDDGVTSYEISFKKGNTEYDFDIKASDGKILKAEKDFDD